MPGVEPQRRFPSPPPSSAAELPMAYGGSWAGEATEQVTTRDACANDGSVATSAAGAAVRGLPQDGGWEQPKQQRPPRQVNTTAAGFNNPSMHPAPPIDGDGPNAWVTKDALMFLKARQAFGPLAQPDQVIAQASTDIWRQRLVKYINLSHGPGRGCTDPESWRFRFLRESCRKNDAFCLVLYQFHCLWSTNRDFLLSILPPSSHEYLGPTFEALVAVLGPNRGIRQRFLTWLACFPFDFDIVAQDDPSFCEMSSRVVRFLTSVAEHWSGWLTHIRDRRYPFMSHELRDNFHLTSPDIQFLMCYHSWTLIGPWNMLNNANFSNVFDNDWRNEMHWLGHRNQQHVHEARDIIRRQYIAVANLGVPETDVPMAASGLTAAQNPSSPVANVNQSYDPAVLPVTSGPSVSSRPLHNAPYPGAQFVQGYRSSVPGHLVQQRPLEVGREPNRGPISGQQRFVQSARANANQPQFGPLVLRPATRVDKSRRYPSERQTQNKFAANMQAEMAGEQSAAPGGAEWPRNQNDFTSVRAGGPENKLYHYVVDFAVKPTLLSPQSWNQSFEFEVMPADMSLRYRLRLCAWLPTDREIHMVDWASSDCVWPPEIYIELNGEAVILRRAKDFRQDVPAELTDMIRQGSNVVKISLPQDPEKHEGEMPTFHFAIEIIATRNLTQTLRMVFEKPAVSAVETEKQIWRRLIDRDDDVTVSISLRDPFSAEMVKTPVRGLHCTHSECLDLQTWLLTRHGRHSRSTTEIAPTDGWKCPMCGKYAGPQCLGLDSYFLHVAGTLLDLGKGQTTRISVGKDGSWAPFEEARGNNHHQASVAQSQQSGGGGQLY
ncbi:MIZ zinc finger protein [Metarhizium album ARSEF 1941]|uniref:MIZ zinc finger protein n=1 Tax=Metarhizium album (strain ARSEF 1941) TaxID=1081103 RepID=A0A0B2WRU7_METAS|nr:MIZ zinc finger protein [Metarhizium album ARSEF 1941]KHN96354.1 MIZ zinc finger protein [Metarhizium album ARSEF 1941]